MTSNYENAQKLHKSDNIFHGFYTCDFLMSNIQLYGLNNQFGFINLANNVNWPP